MPCGIGTVRFPHGIFLNPGNCQVYLKQPNNHKIKSTFLTISDVAARCRTLLQNLELNQYLFKVIENI